MDDGERMNMEVDGLASRKLGGGHEEDDEWELQCSRHGQHTSGGMGMPRRECTGVPDKTVQHNDGK